MVGCRQDRPGENAILGGRHSQVAHSRNNKDITSRAARIPRNPSDELGICRAPMALNTFSIGIDADCGRAGSLRGGNIYLLDRRPTRPRPFG